MPTFRRSCAAVTALKLLLVCLAGYATLCAYLFAIQDRMIFLADVGAGAGMTTPRDAGLEYEDVSIETTDGLRLHGWYVPAAGRRALLFFHGNAGDVSIRTESLRLFHELGLSVLIIDYRGYGRSEGRPSESGLYMDAEAAWAHLVERLDYAPGDIVVFGRSLGAAVAAWIAARREPRALIIESAFTSVPDLGQELYWFLPVRWLSRNRFPTRELVAAVDCPVLVAHGREDEIIPYRHGEQIFAAAAEPRAWLELDGGHNDVGLRILHGAYREGIRRFLESLGD